VTGAEQRLLGGFHPARRTLCRCRYWSWRITLGWPTGSARICATPGRRESRLVNKPDQNSRRDGVRADSAFDVVVDGYDAVYAAAASSPAFARLWADHACGGPFPAEFAHISFLTYDELQVMAQYLALGEGTVLADLACGAGGPGLSIATQCGASVIGVEPSSAGLAQARKRAEQVGLTDRSRYQQGTFASTGLGHGAADAALSVDAIQYAPEKPRCSARLSASCAHGGGWCFPHSR
jgi:hypothetical protein